MSEKSAYDWLFGKQDWLDGKTRSDAITAIVRKEMASDAIKAEDARRLAQRKANAWHVSTVLSILLGGLALLNSMGVIG